MSQLLQASTQWARRPADERFTSLIDMRNAATAKREASRSQTVSSRSFQVMPNPNDERVGLLIAHDPKTGAGMSIATHWSFGQLATLAGAPAGYLRKLPAPMVADAINYGMRFLREPEDVGMLTAANGNNARTLAAVTGPRYGRIWDSDILSNLTSKFGDGLDGDFRVPGEFGIQKEVTKSNTTLFASDRDMFVFLADEKNRVEVANRRDGQTGSLARGFFVWNSEVGAQSMGAAFFLFDYACSNRIVWGAQQFKEIRLRHTSAAPDRWIEQIAPVLEEYAESAAAPIEATIRAAQDRRIGEDLDSFLAGRFTKSQIVSIKRAHETEEGRPIETLWDAVTGVTAYAKTIAWQDERVAVERTGGLLLDLAA